jgi:hypothetical protein
MQNLPRDQRADSIAGNGDWAPTVYNPDEGSIPALLAQQQKISLRIFTTQA